MQLTSLTYCSIAVDVDFLPAMTILRDDGLSYVSSRVDEKFYAIGEKHKQLEYSINARGHVKVVEMYQSPC